MPAYRRGNGCGCPAWREEGREGMPRRAPPCHRSCVEGPLDLRHRRAGGHLGHGFRTRARRSRGLPRQGAAGPSADTRVGPALAAAERGGKGRRGRCGHAREGARVEGRSHRIY
jgi:hypothetical protein